MTTVQTDDPVLTGQVRAELAELVRELCELEAWHKAHPQHKHPRMPQPPQWLREKTLRLKRCWIDCATTLLNTRSRWAHSRNLVPSDIDRDLLDERWGMAGLMSSTTGWGQPFGLRRLSHDSGTPTPVDAERERAAYRWADCFRRHDENGHARPYMIVAHCDNPSDFEQLARDEHGLVVERLPWSWFDPTDCVAVAVSVSGVPPVVRRA